MADPSGGGKFDVGQAVLALKALKTLRSNVGVVFQSLSDGIGAQYGHENKESKFVTELQHQLVAVQTSVKEFEEALSNVESAPGQLQLGNTGLLDQDTTHDVLELYHQLITTYRFTDNLSDYSGWAATLLNQNSLKRSNLTPGLTAKRRRVQPGNQNVPPQTIDNIIASSSRGFDNMKIEISRPHGQSTVMRIAIGHTMKAVVVLKRLTVEQVSVRGCDEHPATEARDDGRVDTWQESRYRVFRKVTENANAAMLHFYSPTFPEIAIKSFFTWLHSYHTLFSSACKKCGRHLHDLLPPTWRDLRTLEPYHEDCKP